MRKFAAGMLVAIALGLASLTIAAAPARSESRLQAAPAEAGTPNQEQIMSNTHQTIFDAVKAGFLTITTTNGYTSNVGQKVNEWQTTPIDAAADPTLLPCVCLSDPKKINLGPPANLDKNSANRTFGIEFEASLILAEANQTAAKARQAEADVIAMIGKDPTWGGLARRTEPGESDLILDKEGTRISGVRMKFTVEYGRRTWQG